MRGGMNELKAHIGSTQLLLALLPNRSLRIKKTSKTKQKLFFLTLKIDETCSISRSTKGQFYLYCLFKLPGFIID